MLYQYNLKLEHLFTSIASTFFDYVTAICNIVFKEKYYNTYNEEYKKLLKDQKTEYENADETKKKELNIYYKCKSAGDRMTKGEYKKGMNLAKATEYVMDYWYVTDKTKRENRDVITVSKEAADALSKSVSAANGNGGLSFDGEKDWDNKEGVLGHQHPGIKNPGTHGPKIIHATNADTGYCPHILFPRTWK